MDFCSILPPGALLTNLLISEVGSVVLKDRYATLAGAQAWAVFLFTSYLAGHLIFLLGSSLDEFYEGARRHTLNAQIARLARRDRLLPWLARALSGNEAIAGRGHLADGDGGGCPGAMTDKEQTIKHRMKGAPS
jgi:hypothetical protein